MRFHYRTGRNSGISVGFFGAVVIAFLCLAALAYALAPFAYLFAWPFLIGLPSMAARLTEMGYLGGLLALFLYGRRLVIRHRTPRPEVPAPPRSERMAVSDRR